MENNTGRRFVYRSQISHKSKWDLSYQVEMHTDTLPSETPISEYSMHWNYSFGSDNLILFE